jgi:uncharacterized membrane protein
MALDPWSLVIILGMAAVTYLTRIGGYWLVGRVRIRGRLAAALEAVPVAALTAIVAPTAMATSPAESAAAAVTLLTAWRAPAPVAIVAGIGTLVLLRYWLA